VSEERELTVAQAKTLLRCRNVWRWSIVNIARRQSVAEHSYLVTIIGTALYDQCMTRHSLLERATFVSYLLQHDAEEALLGDIPATVKQAIELRSPHLLSMVKRDLGAEVAHSHSFDGTPLKVLAKVADYVEAFKFAAENGAPDHVVEFLSDHLRDTMADGEEQHGAVVDWVKLRVIVNEFIDHA